MAGVAAARELADGARRVLGPKLVSAIVHGSIALDSYVSGRSDVDLLLIVEGGVSKRKGHRS